MSLENGCARVVVESTCLIFVPFSLPQDGSFVIVSFSFLFFSVSRTSITNHLPIISQGQLEISKRRRKRKESIHFSLFEIRFQFLILFEISIFLPTYSFTIFNQECNPNLITVSTRQKGWWRTASRDDWVDRSESVDQRGRSADRRCVNAVENTFNAALLTSTVSPYLD